MSNFFLNILNSSKHGDTDMEAGNRSDIELGVMEAGGSRSAHPLNPDSMSAMDPGSIFSYSFPAPNSGTEGGNHAPPLSMQTAIPQPAQFNINGKRSQNDNRVSKVRLVEQRSRIPKMRELEKRYQAIFEQSAMAHQGKADERLNKAEQQLAEANRRADEATKQVEEIRVREEAIERVRVQAECMAKHSEDLSREANEQLLVAIARAEKAEQQAAEKIKEAEERVNVQAGIIAKRTEELSREAHEQILTAIARAEKAEQQSAEKIREAEERIQKAVESAAQLERKFMDAMKRMEGSTEQTGMDVVSDADTPQYVPNRDHRSNNWAQWRSTEDNVPDAEDEAVENLLQPHAEITERSSLMGDVDREHSITEHSGINVPNSTEDGDDMSVESEDQRATATQKGKQKMVPPPRKFSRPSGGARSVTFQMRPGPSSIPRNQPSTSPESSRPSYIPRNQPSASPESSRPSYIPSNQPSASPEPSKPPMPRHQHQRQRRKSFQEPIFGDDAEEESRSSRRPSSRIIYRQSNLRGFTTTRAAQLTAVRESMNRLIGIEKDKQISRIYCATEEEVDEFEEGTATAPDLSPMRPYLNSARHTTWNDVLCDMFIEHFEEEQNIQLTPDNKTKIEIMFLDRLSRLVRPWRESHNLSSEELHAKELKSNQLSRRNTRRVDLYHERLAICYGNLKNRDGSTDLAWKVTTEMVEELGPTGMSSDESELDEKTNKTTYRIKRRLWRARACKDRLILIDSDRNITNAHGGTRPGKPPRERIRAYTSSISERAPKVGCPENYYSREWVANLGSDRMVRALKWEEEKDLGTIDDD